MNILFFLIPKSQVAFVLDNFTLRQVAEKLIAHDYTSIPVLDEEGHYVATVSEGDLFRYVKNHGEMNYRSCESTSIRDIPHERSVKAIRYDSDMDSLLGLAAEENFVPVLDDHGIFMGIITRKAIIAYFQKKVAAKDED